MDDRMDVHLNEFVNQKFHLSDLGIAASPIKDKVVVKAVMKVPYAFYNHIKRRVREEEAKLGFYYKDRVLARRVVAREVGVTTNAIVKILEGAETVKRDTYIALDNYCNRIRT